MGLNIQPAVGAKFQVRVTYGTGSTPKFVDVPGVSNYTENPNPGETTTIRAFEGSAQVVGSAGPPSITMQLSAYNPLAKTHLVLRDSIVNGTVIQCQFTTSGSELLAAGSSTAVRGATVAVATGVATLTQTGTSAVDLEEDEYGPGQVFKIGTNYYVISEITGDDTAIVTTPTGGTPSAVSASTVFQLFRPPLIRGPFSATVSSADFSALEAGNVLSAPLELASVANLPQWKLNESDTILA